MDYSWDKLNEKINFREKCVLLQAVRENRERTEKKNGQEKKSKIHKKHEIYIFFNLT